MQEINNQRAMSERHNNLPDSLENLEKKGDIPIHDLWKWGTEIIHEMHAVNTDTLTYQGRTPEKWIHSIQRETKRKYLEACLQQKFHFYLFVVLVDGLLGMEADDTLKRLVSCLAVKWKKP